MKTLSIIYAFIILMSFSNCSGASKSIVDTWITKKDSNDIMYNKGLVVSEIK